MFDRAIANGRAFLRTLTCVAPFCFPRLWSLILPTATWSRSRPTWTSWTWAWSVTKYWSCSTTRSGTSGRGSPSTISAKTPTSLKTRGLSSRWKEKIDITHSIFGVLNASQSLPYHIGPNSQFRLACRLYNLIYLSWRFFALCLGKLDRVRLKQASP